MSDSELSELISELELISAQPLEERPEAFAKLEQRLRQKLESAGQ